MRSEINGLPGCEFNWTRLISIHAGNRRLERGTNAMSKSSMISKGLGVVAVVIGFLVAIVPHYVFPVCQYVGMLIETSAGKYLPMKCYWTATAEIGLGAAIVLVGLLLIVSKQTETRRVLGTILAALGILVALVPTYLIGVCAMPDHPCRLATQPALILLGVVTVIVGIVAIVTARSQS